MKKLLVGSLTGAILLGAAVLPAFAESTSTASSTPRTVNTACVQTAVLKRESAVASAFDAFSTAVKSALTARSSALNTAWGKTDRKEIRTEVNAAWKTYRASLKSAKQTHNKAVRAAWSGFKTDAKTCGPNAASEESAGQGSELSL